MCVSSLHSGQADLCIFPASVCVQQKPALTGDPGIHIYFLRFPLICPLPPYLQEFLPHLTR